MVWTVSSEDDIEEWKNNILIKFWRENFMNTRKLTINAILLAVGALLHQITPAIGLPMQPDFSLVMLFIIMIINKIRECRWIFNNVKYDLKENCTCRIWKNDQGNKANQAIHLYPYISSYT